MAINIETIIEKALEEAFARALDQAIQSKAEAVFVKALANGSPFGKKLADKIEARLQEMTTTTNHGRPSAPPPPTPVAGVR